MPKTDKTRDWAKIRDWSKIKDWSIILVAVVILIGIVGWGVTSVLVIPRKNAFDFYSIWYGARVFLVEGRNPYSDSVTEEIQLAIFGRTLPEGKNQQPFAHPAYVSWLLAPLALLPTFQWAVTVWLVLLFVSLVGTLILWANILRPQLSVKTLLIWLAIGLLIFRYTMVAFVLAQVTPLVFFSLVTTLYMLRQRRGIGAGAWGWYALVKPELGALGIFTLWLTETQGAQRRRMAYSFIGTGIVLGALTFIRFPGWLGAFINMVRDYAGYTPTVWPLGLLPTWSLRLLGIGLIIGLAVLIGREAHRQPKDKRTILNWNSMIALGLTLLPQTGRYAMVLALLPLGVLFWWGRGILNRIILGLVILLSWWAVAFPDAPSWDALISPPLLLCGLFLIAQQSPTPDDKTEPRIIG